MRRLLIATLLLASAAAAQAHAFLERSEPKVGETIKQAPAAVRIWFTEGLEPAFSGIKVSDAAGKEVDRKDGEVGAKNDRQMTASLPPLGLGVYRVDWRAVAKDTHVTHGTFNFTVAP